MRRQPWRDACIRGCVVSAPVVGAARGDYPVEPKLVVCAQLVYHAWGMGTVHWSV
jgi:hypothetical protein